MYTRSFHYPVALCGIGKEDIVIITLLSHSKKIVISCIDLVESE